MKKTALVHIGSGKAGSSTLQDDLFKNREALLENGIFIPEVDGRIMNNRETFNFFQGRMDSTERSKIINSVRRANSNYVVFSSEFLWGDEACVRGVSSQLAELFDDIKVVLYLREPSEYYRSFQQQSLKATDKMMSPFEWRAKYKERIQMWESRFGSSLTLLAFQPSTFQSGLTADFLERFAGFKSIRGSEFADAPSNASEVAEVTATMQRYFRYCHQGMPRVFRVPADLLRKAMSDYAAENCIGSKARLKPTVRDYIHGRHADELFWLRDQKGLQFDSVDYHRLNQIRETDLVGSFTDFSDIVELQEGASDALLFNGIRILSELLVEERGASAKSSLADSGLGEIRSELVTAVENADDIVAVTEVRQSQLKTFTFWFARVGRFLLRNIPSLGFSFRKSKFNRVVQRNKSFDGRED